MAQTILFKKIEQNHGAFLYKKSLLTEHRKNYILLDKNNFVKMFVSTLTNFVYALAQKLVWISKQNFTCSFGTLRLRAD